MKPRQTDRVGDRWLAGSVELEDGETIRYRTDMMLRQRGEITGVLGELLLTNSRLVWMRRGVALPFVRRLLKVPLGRIGGWSIERSRWLGRSRGTVRVHTASETIDIITIWTQEDAEEWTEALADVVAEAGIATREAAA